MKYCDECGEPLDADGCRYCDPDHPTFAEVVRLPSMSATYCEVEGCYAAAKPCECGAAHCVDHPHVG